MSHACPCVDYLFPDSPLFTDIQIIRQTAAYASSALRHSPVIHLIHNIRQIHGGFPVRYQQHRLITLSFLQGFQNNSLV